MPIPYDAFAGQNYLHGELRFLVNLIYLFFSSRGYS